MADDSGTATKAVGPYLLQRTLGKGQTGIAPLYAGYRRVFMLSINRAGQVGSSLYLQENCGS